MGKKRKALGPKADTFSREVATSWGTPYPPGTPAASVFSMIFDVGAKKPEPLVVELREAAERQFEELLRGADDLGPAPAEMPIPPVDLTAYDHAYASARRNCRHDELEETLHSRGEYCRQCGRYLSAAQINEARRR